MHTKRTGHTEFVDKTSEAAKPISLEVPKEDAASHDDTVGASADQNEGDVFFFFFFFFPFKLTSVN